MLAQKDAEEAAALEDLRAQARKELSEWYSRSDDQLNQTKISNRWGRGAPSTWGLCFHILVNFWRGRFLDFNGRKLVRRKI